MSSPAWSRVGLSWAVLAAAGLLLLVLAAFWRSFFLPSPAPGPGGLLAQRYDNPRLSGTPGPAYLETRTSMSDASDPDFRASNFSLRLTGFFEVTLPGLYRLGVESDDDGRILVDGQMVVDNSGEHPPRLALARVWLGPGRHLLEVEYAQRGGGAELKLWWARPLGGLKPLTAAQLRPAAQPIGREEAQAWGWQAHLAGLPCAALVVWGLAMALVRIWLPTFDRLRHLALASLLMVAAMWCNSGTLAPLATAQIKPYVWQVPGACAYLGSIDHQHFQAAFWMLEGEPVEKWSFSLVLRRILQPLLAYPFIKAWGYFEGGFLASLLLHLGMMVSWALFLRRQAGPQGMLWGLYGLASLPGVYYWSSLPYSYAFIVPGSVWCFLALVRLGQAQGAAATLGWAAVLGGLFLGYDLWPFFLPAALFLVWWRQRRLGLSALTLLPLIAPTALMILLLSALGAYGAPVQEGHEPLAVFLSFLGEIDLAAWWNLIAAVPWVAWLTCFYSNYVFLPALFLALLLLWRRRWPVAITAAEGCLLLGMLAVFLLNNLAPPYKGWQFRGDFYLRFYQPLLVVLLFFSARKFQAAGARSWVGLLCGLTLLANTYLVFAPVLGLPGAGYMHWRFGRDGALGLYERNLANYGRLPLGICPARAPRSAGP